MSRIVGQMEIPLARVKVDQENVRKSVGAIGELEDSIEHYGVLEPIIVRKVGDGYRVVAGHLRLTAAKNVGLKSIPAIVKEMTDAEAFIESAVENLQRHDLEPNERAETYAKAYKVFGSQDDIAKAFNVSPSTVRQQLEAARLIGLIREVTKKPQHVAVSIPADSQKVESISRAAKSLFGSSPKRQVEMYEALKDRPREDVKRAITYLKAKAEMEPEMVSKKPVASVVSEAFRSASVSVKIQFDSRVSKALVRAAEDRGLSWEDIVRTATEKWLDQQGFL
jgi:ParB/RepB/Spo0J family partition protein